MKSILNGLDAARWLKSGGGGRARTARTLLTATFGLAVAAAVAGCKRSDQQAAAPPPLVTVSEPLMHEVVEWDEYIGRLDAVETVQLRARVGGLLETVQFNDGQIVQKGQLLFTIDRRPFQAEFDRADGEVKSAESQLKYASVELERVEQTRKSGAASGNEYETKRLAQGEAIGSLAAAKAAREAARLNLEFTEVRAPISGQISRRLVTPGNLVNGANGNGTLLTEINSLNPIYCYVEADEASILKYQRLAAEKKRVSARESPIPCYLNLADETGFPHEGKVDFVDNRLNPGTGTLQARGVFANPNNRLIPGFFGRLRVAGSGRYQALLVPDSAVNTDQGQKYLLLANNDKVERRSVKIGSLFGSLRAIESGVGEHDKVIINGMQRARPDGQVKSELKQIPASAFETMAPGSPATQALPATRNVPTPPPSAGETSAAPADPSGGGAGSMPATQPSGEPSGAAAGESVSPAALLAGIPASSPSPASMASTATLQGPATAPGAASPDGAASSSASSSSPSGSSPSGSSAPSTQPTTASDPATRPTGGAQ